nr:NS3 [Trichopteran jingmen-related virus]
MQKIKKIGLFENRTTDYVLGGFNSVVFLTTTLILATYLELYFFIIFYGILFGRYGVSWKKKESNSLYYFGIIAMTLTTVAYMIPCYVMLLNQWDKGNNGKGKNVIDKIFKKIHEVLTDVQLPYIHPLIGANSEQLAMVKNWLDDNIEEMKRNVITGVITNVVRLRDVDISSVPQTLVDKATIPADQVHARYEEIGNQTRIAIFCFVGLLSFCLIGPVGICVFVGLFMAASFEDNTGVKFIEMNRGIIFRDGIYRVTTTTFGFRTSQGIAVVMGGILHVPYHVTKARPLMYGMTRVSPYYINIGQDLVTYGGPPKITNYQAGDKVYVNCETDQGRSSYHVSEDVERKGNVITWQGVTKPGESGSPVLALREETLVLLGLAGRYIKDNEETVEYSNTTPVVEGDSMLEKITLHPGAGKTWHIIPELIRKNKIKLDGKRILVAGPTRVVCKELYGSISKETETGLNIKDSTHRRETAQVQIAAHRTALKLLVNRERIVRNLGLLIIDEAHMDDTATILLRKFARHAIENGTRVVELSATLDGLTNNASNYHIDDSTIEAGSVEIEVGESLSKGERVMVFVPSIKNGVSKRLAEKYKQFGVVKLSRETFLNAMKGVQDIEKRLIITTDIAECGINVPELDTVIDTGEKFTYVSEGGMIIGKKVGITEASRTQRRGRIGRTKVGNYKEIPSRNSDDYVSAAKFDADLLSSGRNWTTGRSNWDLLLSDEQFTVWLDKDITPVEVYMDYNNLGLRRDAISKREVFKTVKNGEKYYVGCRDNCGKCEGKYQYFDERAHDRIVSGVERTVEGLD